MAEYKCKKCGLKAWSKCVHNRNVFIRSWQWNDDSSIGYIVNNMFIDRKGESIVVSLRSWLFEREGVISEEEGLIYLAESILAAKEHNVLKYVLCGTHEWELVSEECDLGCHHK